jgi:deazaflavin-dependent oxidoreductase (nitroreductase family)
MKFGTINPGVIEQFRAGQEIEGLPGVSRKNHILLTTVGRRSGEKRTVPLRVFAEEGDRIVVVAGNGGEPSHPAWYLNLLADSRATVENDRETYEAVASVVTGEERDRLWKSFDEQQPGLSEYLANAGREVAVVALTRI